MLRFYTDQVVLPNTLQVSVDWRQTGFLHGRTWFYQYLGGGLRVPQRRLWRCYCKSWGSKIRVFSLRARYVAYGVF